MDSEIVIFWLVAFSCVSALVMLLTRVRLAVTGWVVVYLSIMLVAVGGRFGAQPVLIYAAAGLWILLVLVPALISRCICFPASVPWPS